MIKSVIYGLFGVGAAGAVSLCDLCATENANGTAKQEHVVVSVVRDTTVTLKVEGMTCGGCVLGVRKVLTKLDGVTKADVSYERGQAVVAYDPGKVTVEKIIDAIETLGYKASIATV